MHPGIPTTEKTDLAYEVARSHCCSRKDYIIARNKFIGIKNIVKFLQSYSHFLKPGHLFLNLIVYLLTGFSICNCWQDKSCEDFPAQDLNCSGCQDSFA